MLVRKINISQTFLKTFTNLGWLECSRNKEINSYMNENAFSYTYSAALNQEVLNIRKKYLPCEETRLEELKRLDSLVQNSGVTQSLCIGIGGCLIFGLGMCLAMEVIGQMIWLGVILSLIGVVGMLAAFPVYLKFFNKAKAQHTPRILELASQLSGQVS